MSSIRPVADNMSSSKKDEARHASVSDECGQHRKTFGYDTHQFMLQSWQYMPEAKQLLIDFIVLSHDVSKIWNTVW